MQNQNSLQLYAIIAFALIASSLVRKGRLDPQAAYLQPKQRIRPLMLEYLDPLYAAIIVGPVLWHEMNLSTWHVVASLLGASIGIPIGVLRSRVQFVRAAPSSRSVVLTRSRAEYALLVVLIILRSAEGFVKREHAQALTLVAAALLALPIGESLARSLSIVQKYRASVVETPSMGLPD